jgi:drug/metabolite transporter (DMT)-like permease
MKKQVFASSILLLVSIIWGLAFVFQDIAIKYIPSFTISAIRFLFASIALAPVVIYRHCHKKKDDKEEGNNKNNFFSKDLLVGGFICGLMLCAGGVLQQYGLVYHTVGKTGFITTSYILIIPIISLFFKKYSSWNTYLAVVIAMCGVYLLCTDGGLSFEWSDSILFGSAFSYAIQIMCVNYLVNEKHLDPVDLSLVQLIYSSIISGLIALFVDKGQVTWEGILNATPSLLYIGVISAAIGYTLQNVTQKYIPETIAGLIMSLESVFSLIFGVFVLKQEMHTAELIGCIIIFSAVVLAQLPLNEWIKVHKENKVFTKSEVKEK